MSCETVGGDDLLGEDREHANTGSGSIKRDGDGKRNPRNGIPFPQMWGRVGGRLG